jgi:predicted permease
MLVFALGLGATTAVFAIVHAQLFRALPYPRADRLVAISETSSVDHADSYEVSVPNFEDWRAGDRDFASEALYDVGESTALIGDQGRRVLVAEVSEGFFPTLGVAPALGRPLVAADARGPAVVLGARFWKRQLGGEPGAIGRAIRIAGAPRTVVGVMPPGYLDEIDAWTPLTVEGWMRNRSVHLFQEIARLRDGVRLDDARRNLARVAQAAHRRDPASDPGHGATLRSLRDFLVAPIRGALLALAGAIALVWLIACGDLAAILLGRAERRRREVGIRIALGAGRGRIAASLLTEGALVGVLGGLAGFAMFAASQEALRRLLPDAIPRTGAIEASGATLAFSLAAGVLSAIAFSLGPIALLLGRRRQKRQPLAAGRPLVGALVVGQVSLCLMLLTGAGLLGRSFLRLAAVDPGFREERLLTMTLDLAGTGWTERAQARAFAGRLEARMAAVPGVSSASATSRLPLAGGESNGELTVEGATVPEGDKPPASFRRIFPSYFSTMGIPLLRGRDFDAHDDGRAMVVIINKALADRCWPGRDPLGRRIKVGPPEREPWLTVVGVAGDVRNVGLAEAPRLATYEPFSQRPADSLTLVARVRGNGAGAAGAIRAAVHSENPGVIVYDEAWMTERVRASLAPRRIYTATIAFFGGATLLLAGVGVFGLLSGAVAARTREIGVRVAVGARAGDIAGMVVGWGARRLLAGVAIGMPLSLAAARVLAHAIPGALFEVSPSDAATCVGVVILLTAVGLAAAAVPARRAARLDPMASLRTE